MIVVKKAELKGTPRDASGPGWTSIRLLVKSDEMGFSMTETHVEPGTELHLQYKNHIEACYCIGGEGEVREELSGAVHDIRPGVLYAPDAHDAHVVRVVGSDPLHLICVFSPALEGTEVHGPDGSYAAPS
ncbi:MAG: ectoine synthase [Pseudomonadota bacterium]